MQEQAMKYNHYLIIAIAIMAPCLQAMDNPHFYRATNMFLEPRLEHDYLTTFNATVGGGSTSYGRSCNNTLVALFDIYGRQSFQALNANSITPPSDLDNPFSQMLQDLAQLPQRPDFATVSIDGTFNIVEANLSLAQNLSHGLFLFFHLPIRRLTIKDISFIDRSPNDSLFPNKNTAQWQTVFQNIHPLFVSYGLDPSSTVSTGVGDLSCWLGWTHNYQETQTLDFVDFSFMTGFLSPTGKKENIHEPFSLPTGYNGHWGFPLYIASSIGFYEWVTIGGYVNSLIFFNKNRCMRIKTDNEQSGIIKLAYANVSDHRSPLVNTGLYIKADHVGHNVSVTAAYSFASQQKSHLTPHNPIFDATIINSDETLKGWNMHTINFLAEYDFAREGSNVGNRIGLFYNLQVAGSRVFDTNIFGGNYGIDISWSM